MKGLIDAIEGKGSLTKVEGIIQASDEIFRSLGLRQKVKSVKSIGTKKIKDATEEEVEVQVEKVNMNELVNIFYRIENAPMMLTIKKVTVKTSFENPALLDMAMTLGLIKAE
jgi:general secretion pathway protein M